MIVLFEKHQTQPYLKVKVCWWYCNWIFATITIDCFQVRQHQASRPEICQQHSLFATETQAKIFETNSSKVRYCMFNKFHFSLTRMLRTIWTVAAGCLQNYDLLSSKMIQGKTKHQSSREPDTFPLVKASSWEYLNRPITELYAFWFNKRQFGKSWNQPKGKRLWFLDFKGPF